MGRRRGCWRFGWLWVCRGCLRPRPLCYKDECLQLTEGRVGAVTQNLYDTLTGIQTGRLADTFGWVKFVE